MKPTLKLSLVLIMTLVCGSAMAQNKMVPNAYQGPRIPMPRPDSVEAGAFYTNLAVNACTGCNYSSDNGYFVLGATNCFAPGSVQWIAFPFMASKTGIVKKALVSITDWGGCTSTAKQVTIGI